MARKQTGRRRTGSSGAAPRQRARLAAPRRAPEPPVPDAVLREVFRTAATPTAIIGDGVVLDVNEALARALGQDAAALRGPRLGELLPPIDGEVPTPDAGRGPELSHDRGRRARTRRPGGGARAGGGTATLLGSAALTLAVRDEDTAPSRALLALSRELAEARTEDADHRRGGARARGPLPRALVLRSAPRPEDVRAHHALRARPAAPARARPARAAGGRRRAHRPLARRRSSRAGSTSSSATSRSSRGATRRRRCRSRSAGQLFGIVNLEYPRGGPGDPLSDAALLYQVANHAALGVRNLRSVEELTYLKTYLEDLIEHANALICVVNRAREVIVWNAALARLTGVPREEALGAELSARVPPDDTARVEAVLARGFAGETVDGFETRLLVRGGREVRIAVNTAPIFGAAGEVEGVIAIGHDLTLVRSLAGRRGARRAARRDRPARGGRRPRAQQPAHRGEHVLGRARREAPGRRPRSGRPGEAPRDPRGRASASSGSRATSSPTRGRPARAPSPSISPRSSTRRRALAKPALKDAGAVLEKRSRPRRRWRATARASCRCS